MFGLLTNLLRGGNRAIEAHASGKADARSPADQVAAPVHVLRNEGLVRLVDGYLTFAAPDGREDQIRLDEVSQLSLFGNAGVTSPCLRELMRRGIPVVWRSPNGYYLGQTIDLAGQSTAVRRAQYRAAEDSARVLSIACALVKAKLVNARGLLRRSAANASDTLYLMRKLAKAAGKASSLPQLLGIEGAGAAAFYAALPEMIAAGRRGDFPWDGRRRRPPTDAMNALFSYLYAVVAGECAAAALAAGLDPLVGFLHSERPGRPALALDLLEPFRPVIADAVALAVVNRGEIRREHFETSDESVLLNNRGRHVALNGLERRFADTVPARTARETPMSWREAIAAQARFLAKTLRTSEQFVCFERG